VLLSLAKAFGSLGCSVCSMHKTGSASDSFNLWYVCQVMPS
jgi:hypothetical protein